MGEKIDLSVYLVTDSTQGILRGRDLCVVVEDALKGGKATQSRINCLHFSSFY
jgi:hypothetical protein